MNFYIYSAKTGHVLRTGHCPQDMLHLQAQEGELLGEGEAGFTDAVDLPTGMLMKGANPPAPLDYRQRRVAAYPSFGDQLDALWKFVATGTPPAELLARIQAVKDEHPKPA